MPIGSAQWMYASGGDFTIDQSLRFDDDRESHLTWTPASNSNRDTWTYSTWIKLTEVVGGSTPIFQVGTDDGVYYTRFTLISSGKLNFTQSEGPVLGFTGAYKSIRLLRDFGAWYHLVLAVDKTQAAEANRVKMYV